MHTTSRHSFSGLHILLIAVLAFSLGFGFGQKNAAAPADSANGAPPISVNGGNLKIRGLEDVLALLKKSYYDASKLEPIKLEYGAVKGFVAGIGDPYTVFMTPQESNEFQKGLEGELEGIGAELEIKDGKLIVITPLKESPAEKVGLKPGDIIYKIGDSLTQELTLFEAISKIRGPKDTTVTLTIKREGTQEPFQVKITRKKITVESVRVKKLDGDIFYIEINQFNNHTVNELDKIIENILLQKASGIVLDLRGNGGGYLDTSIIVLSEFIEGEKTAVIVKKRNNTDNEELKTNGTGRLKDLKLAVLINKGSASASEIVAGAIKDYRRGILIGEKTFGKGSVQEINKLKDGSSLRMTVAKWFTPKDNSIDEVGITPDKEVKLTEEDAQNKRDPQLDEAVRYLKN